MFRTKCVKKCSLFFTFSSVFLFILSVNHSLAAMYGMLAIGNPHEDIGSTDMAGVVNILPASSTGLTSYRNQMRYQGTAGVSGAYEEGDQFGNALGYGDFNGDGIMDLVIGVYHEDIGSLSDAGVVHVLYGGSGGTPTTNTQMWHQDSPGINGVAEAGDMFGKSLAGGDFNGDGFCDLAVGVIFEEIETLPGAGAVNVIYGSRSGLTAAGDQVWHQDSAGIIGNAEAGDSFGQSLASGDFNNDGYADLAVGASGEDIDGYDRAGVVNIIYGSASGLTASGDQLWYQDSPGIEGNAEDGDQFGYSLQVGDFNGDQYQDLAIQVFEEELDGIERTGAINVIYGSATGLSSTGNQFWNQNSKNIQGNPAVGQEFGAGMAAGDFDGDGYDELAVGVPRMTVSSNWSAGAVHVIPGSSLGLSNKDIQVWHQDSAFIPGVTGESKLFGYPLTAGDMNGDGYADLAIGIPYEEVDGIRDAGAVNVIFGSDSGLTAINNQLWTQNSEGVAGEAEEQDHFGRQLLFVPPGSYEFPWYIILPTILGNSLSK